jgi:hypothetical protein
MPRSAGSRHHRRHFHVTITSRGDQAKEMGHSSEQEKYHVAATTEALAKNRALAIHYKKYGEHGNSGLRVEKVDVKETECDIDYQAH